MNLPNGWENVLSVALGALVTALVGVFRKKRKARKNQL